MVSKEKAIAIVGHLFSVDADQAAGKAQQLKVPLSPSPKEPPSNKEDFVLRNFLTPPEQGPDLVKFAMKEFELGTFAVFLHPNSPLPMDFILRTFQ